MGSLRNAFIFIGGNFDEIVSGNLGYETELVWQISSFRLRELKKMVGDLRNEIHPTSVLIA